LMSLSMRSVGSSCRPKDGGGGGLQITINRIFPD